MAILINAYQLKKSFGARPLFDSLTFSIESKDRIGMIGPNGAGKSTLLKILAGLEEPDSGTLSVQKGLKIGYLEQVPKFAKGTTIISAVMEGANENDKHDWKEISRAEELMSRLSINNDAGINGETLVDKLSGGLKKRIAIARELFKNPDLLLLDEPTNHLDIESIAWLENLLSEAKFATLTITHDRLFLQRVSNRILEVNRRFENGLLSSNGSYVDYLETKESVLTNQERVETKLKNTLRRETEWLRQGAKARTTKQQARIKRAGELEKNVEELEFRNRQGEVSISFTANENAPKKLIEAKNISKYYLKNLTVPEIDLLITPGSRIGLLGKNGSGKSTLIKLLLNAEKSDSGTIFHSEHLKFSWFEQNRESLNPELTIRKTICPSGDHVIFRGSSIHINGYMDKFLFSNAQLDMAVGKLSGGEQSRLLLAKLMLQDANVLVLDEPTNDLDIETLNVLETQLAEFPGAVILVSHDRYFLDQVTNKIYAFVNEFKNGFYTKKIIQFSSLEQWENWSFDNEERIDAHKNEEKKKSNLGTQSTSTNKKKLSYKEERELESMEKVIAEKEAKLSLLENECSENASNSSKLTELTQEMQNIQSEIEKLFERWNELEAKKL